MEIYFSCISKFFWFIIWTIFILRQYNEILQHMHAKILHSQLTSDKLLSRNRLLIFGIIVFIFFFCVDNVIFFLLCTFRFCLLIIILVDTYLARFIFRFNFAWSRCFWNIIFCVVYFFSSLFILVVNLDVWRI